MTPTRYNTRSAHEHGWTLAQIHHATGERPRDMGDVDGFKLVQAKLGVKADGLFGPGSFAALRTRLVQAPLVEGRIQLRHQAGWGWPRTRAVSHNMLHHTVTRSIEATIRVLDARGLSTNYIIGPDGTIAETAPPSSKCAHAGEWNGHTIGIDIVNPYDPKLWRASEPWAAPVPVPWGVRRPLSGYLRRHVVPDTPAALASLRWLLEHLCVEHKLGAPSIVDAGVRGEWGGRNVLCHGTVAENRWDGWAAVMGLAG